jgi:hypothetical protein
LLDRNRLEIIRFGSADAQRQAIGLLMERGMLNFTSSQEEEWLVGGHHLGLSCEPAVARNSGG